MKLIAILAPLGLAACATVPAPAPIVDVSGPKFARSQLECGTKPAPPDPARATGKTAAIYENRLGAWGQGCSDRLRGIAGQLEAAGQVSKAAAP